MLLDRSLGTSNGRDLVNLLRQAMPAAQTLFFTGHPLNKEEAHMADGVVKKPLSLRELAARLNGLKSR